MIDINPEQRKRLHSAFDLIIDGFAEQDDDTTEATLQKAVAQLNAEDKLALGAIFGGLIVVLRAAEGKNALDAVVEIANDIVIAFSADESAN